MIRTILSEQQWERIAPELPGKAGDPGATARDNRLFVEASCGSRAPARPGAICRTTSANGTAYTPASGAGRKRASGSGLSRPCPMIPISNTCSSTRRTSGSISMAPAQKGDSKSGHRQVARRLDDEDRGARRCPRQSGPLRPLARPASRHHQFRRSHGRSRLHGSHRRQGLRCPLAARALGGWSIEAVIPLREGTTGHAAHDAEMYKWRHLVENFFCAIKAFRRIATRYEKTDTCFAAMINLVAVVLWTR